MYSPQSGLLPASENTSSDDLISDSAPFSPKYLQIDESHRCLGRASHSSGHNSNKWVKRTGLDNNGYLLLTSDTHFEPLILAFEQIP